MQFLSAARKYRYSLILCVVPFQDTNQNFRSNFYTTFEFGASSISPQEKNTPHLWENGQEASGKLGIKKVVPFPTGSLLGSRVLCSLIKTVRSGVLDLAIRIFNFSRGTYGQCSWQSRTLLPLEFKVVNTKWIVSWLRLFTSFIQPLKQVSL